VSFTAPPYTDEKNEMGIKMDNSSHYVFDSLDQNLQLVFTQI
jgi:hypothetical protein